MDQLKSIGKVFTLFLLMLLLSFCAGWIRLTMPTFDGDDQGTTSFCRSESVVRSDNAHQASFVLETQSAPWYGEKMASFLHGYGWDADPMCESGEWGQKMEYQPKISWVLVAGFFEVAPFVMLLIGYRRWRDKQEELSE